jgi:AmmeMemoRadiSam system protein B
MKRKPAVAGAFYSSSPKELKAHVASLMAEGQERKRAIAAMSPHAGLMYSGGVAGLVYSAMEPPASFVLLGPNHTGMGDKVAMMAEGSWELPTGSLEIDNTLADTIASITPAVTRDDSAHMYEHSLEVQLPFIIESAPEARIVPIAIMSATLDELMELGRAVASAVREAKYPVVVVASTDMSHFISDKEARELDQHALDRVLDLDPEGLYRTVLEEGITMCGFMPTVAMLSASRELGAKRAELLRYATSAEVSGDFDKVVGYAGVLIS